MPSITTVVVTVLSCGLLVTGCSDSNDGASEDAAGTEASEGADDVNDEVNDEANDEANDDGGEQAPFVAVSASLLHTCALRSDATVHCWGANGTGALGDGTTADRALPGLVAGGREMLDLAAGGASNGIGCAIAAPGSLVCWGEGSVLHTGSDVDRLEPTPMLGFDAGWTAVSAGNTHVCGLKDTGRVTCFGNLTDDMSREVVGIVDAARIISGSDSLCAITTDSRAICRGDTFTDASELPADWQPHDEVVTLPFENVVAADGGESHVCIGLGSGEVWCWGSNTDGQLGNGGSEPLSPPVLVEGLPAAPIVLSSGWHHTCALLDDDGLYCWGKNDLGQLGDGTTETRRRAVAVQGLDGTVTGIGAGGNHSCAVFDDGGIACWGHNHVGQLGDGTDISRTTPVRVGSSP